MNPSDKGLPNLDGYKNVQVILPDVYRRGGSFVLPNMVAPGEGEEKNAIIILDSMRTELSEQRSDANGADSALQDLRRRLKSSEEVQNDNGTTIAKGIDLDLIFVPNPGNTTMETLLSPNEDIAKLLEGKNRVYITSNPNTEINLKLKGYTSEDPAFLKTDPSICSQGFLEGTEELQAKLLEVRGDHKHLPLEKAIELLGQNISPNQFIRFPGKQKTYAHSTGVFQRNGLRSRMTEQRVELIGKDGTVDFKQAKYHIQDQKFSSVMGISARDAEQYIGLDRALLDPNIEVVFLTGQAGSGKTVLAYAAMMAQIADFKSKAGRHKGKPNAPPLNHYDKGVLLKSISTVGSEEVGFLPGNLLEKLHSHLEPFEQAHELTILDKMMPFSDVFYELDRANRFGGPRFCRETKGTFENKKFELPKKELVKLTYSGFMRGTSFHNALIGIDEAQNFTPYVMQMMMQRAAEGSKLIIMGDPYQTDNPDCSPSFNGFSWAVKNFMDKPYSALVNLPKSHRSQASEDVNRFAVYK